MHNIRHRRLAISLKLSALFFIIALVAALSFLGILADLFIRRYFEQLLPLGITFASTIVATIISFLYASKSRCQLCQDQLMLPKKCTKHANSRSLFGSYRLKVSLDLLLKNKFTCHLCGESFATAVISQETPAAPLTTKEIARTSAHRPITTLRQSEPNSKKVT